MNITKKLISVFLIFTLVFTTLMSAAVFAADNSAEQFGFDAVEPETIENEKINPETIDAEANAFDTGDFESEETEDIEEAEEVEDTEKAQKAENSLYLAQTVLSGEESGEPLAVLNDEASFWSVDQNPTYASASVGENKKDITLECKTTGKNKAEISAVSDSIKYASSSVDIHLSFGLAVSGFSDNVHKAELNLASGGTKIDFVTLEGGSANTKIYLFGSDTGKTAENDSEMSFEAVINLGAKTAKVTLDNTEVFSGSVDALSSLDPLNLCVEISNRFTKKHKGTTSFSVKDFSFSTDLALEMVCDKTNFTEGDSAELNFVIPEEGWEKIEIYANGAYQGEILPGETTFLFKPKKPGTYVIRAVAKANSGTDAEATKTLVFAANVAPNVSVEGFADGDSISFDYNAKKQLKVKATDSDGSVERIEVYLFSKLAKTVTGASATVDLDEIGIGTGTTAVRFVAYDNLEAEKSATVYVTVTKSVEGSTFFEDSDFERSSETKFVSGMTDDGGECWGYCYEDTVDADHGKSMIIGATAGEKTNSSQKNVNISFKDAYSGQRLEFDMNVVEAVTGNKFLMNFGVRKDGGAIAEFMNVTASNFVFSGNNFAYEPGKWYHITVTLSFSGASSSYSAQVDGEYVARSIPLDLATHTHYRFMINHFSTKTYGKIAVDNINFSSFSVMPTISEVGGFEQAGGNAVSGGTKEIGVYLSGAMLREDLTKENIKLLCGGAEVETELVRFNSNTNCIEITTKNPLDYETEYAVVISENVRFSDTEAIGRPMSYYFKTAKGETAAQIISAKKSNGDLVIKVSADNSSDKEKDFYVFVTLLDKNERIVSTKVFKQTVGGGESESFDLNVSGGDEHIPYVFVADGIKSSKIYTAKKFKTSQID